MFSLHYSCAKNQYTVICIENYVSFEYRKALVMLCCCRLTAIQEYGIYDIMVNDFGPDPLPSSNRCMLSVIHFCISFCFNKEVFSQQ